MITYQGIKSGAVPAPVQQPQVRDHDLDLSEIKLDQSAQPRESLNNDRIAEYAEAMKAGDQFPPLTVFHDGTTYWLADGFHRHYAAQHAGRKHIRCCVRQGGLRDAILYSVGANAKHGLARSQADKERAVLRLLNDEEWGKWSDREIAKRCLVDHKTVARIRRDASGEIPQIERKVQRGGTVYTQKVAKTAFRAENAQKSAADQKQEIGDEPVVAQGIDAADHLDAIAEEITPQRNIRDEFVALWCAAGPEDRADIVSYLRALGYRIETNAGGGDVDRSATRASSAVEVGATNSPDGADSICVGSATRGQAAPSGECPEAPSRSAEKMVISETAAADRDAGNTPTCALKPRDDLTVGTNSQSAVPTVEAVAGIPHAPLEPPATANPFNNPRCQHPETCHLAHSRNECFDCNFAWSKRPKEEQVRLWAEAVQAARAA